LGGVPDPVGLEQLTGVACAQLGFGCWPKAEAL